MKSFTLRSIAMLSASRYEAWLCSSMNANAIGAPSANATISFHITGSLIARHYIQSLGGDEHVSRLVTFISPQHGLPKAPLAFDIAGWPALADLSPGSDFLHAVNDAPLPANVPVTSIYTCTDEFIQPYKTSIIRGAHNIGLCGHGFVGHYQFFWDSEIYRVMYKALTDDGSGKADWEDTTDDDESGAGCNTGGGAAGGAMLLVVGAIVLGRRRRHIR